MTCWSTEEVKPIPKMGVREGIIENLTELNVSTCIDML